MKGGRDYERTLCRYRVVIFTCTASSAENGASPDEASETSLSTSSSYLKRELSPSQARDTHHCRTRHSYAVLTELHNASFSSHGRQRSLATHHGPTRRRLGRLPLPILLIQSASAFWPSCSPTHGRPRRPITSIYDRDRRSGSSPAHSRSRLHSASSGGR